VQEQVIQEDRSTEKANPVCAGTCSLGQAGKEPNQQPMLRRSKGLQRCCVGRKETSFKVKVF
jgi:hypothetical protein